MLIGHSKQDVPERRATFSPLFIRATCAYFSPLGGPLMCTRRTENGARGIDARLRINLSR